MPLFMHVDNPDIEGPYQVDGLDDKVFKIDSYSHGLYQPTSEGGAHSRTISSANVSELIVTKKVDSSTALLMQALCKNTHFDGITIYDCVQVSDADEVTPAVKITMTGTAITSLTYSGADGAEATQVLGIKFDTIEWEITTVDRVSGQLGAAQMYKWEATKSGAAVSS